jgi:DNA-binding NtrC family response regulator
MQFLAIAGFDPPRPGNRPRILIAEDDVDIWHLIENAIQQAIPDARIQWASDSASARLALECCRFDAVLADYMLEDETDGWTLITEVRRLQPDARVGMTSALPIRPPRNGACPFLRKPFEIASCADFVKRLLT